MSAPPPATPKQIFGLAIAFSALMVVSSAIGIWASGLSPADPAADPAAGTEGVADHDPADAERAPIESAHPASTSGAAAHPSDLERRHAERASGTPSKQAPVRSGSVLSAQAGETTAADPGADAAIAGAEGGTWTDPVNKDVLGPNRWMAQPSDSEKARVNAILDAPMPKETRITDVDRRAGIEIVRAVVDDCMAELRKTKPAAAGRIAIRFKLASDGTEAKITEPEVSNAWKLTDAALHICIQTNVVNLGYPAGPGDPIEVEHGFHYED